LVNEISLYYDAQSKKHQNIMNIMYGLTTILSGSVTAGGSVVRSAAAADGDYIITAGY
jgi:hypothetical protein